MLHIIYQKIDKCPNFCMLYCLENANLTKYKTCGHARYKLITRKGRTLVTQRKLRYFLITIGLQRLFKSPKTNEHITWHHSHDAVDGVMMHSFNGEVQKHFNRVHCQFSMESRNVHLRSCINGFNLFGSFIASYFCWSVIFTIYNLLLAMCMGSEFMFLSTFILGPNSPDQNINICLRTID